MDGQETDRHRVVHRKRKKYMHKCKWNDIKQNKINKKGLK